MKANVVVACVLTAWMPSVLFAQSIDARSHADLANALVNGTDLNRFSAIAAIKAIPAIDRESYLVAAMTTELTRLASDLEQRRLAIADGKPLLAADDEGAYLFQVLDILAEHEDPVVIPALTNFIS